MSKVKRGHRFHRVVATPGLDAMQRLILAALIHGGVPMTLSDLSDSTGANENTLRDGTKRLLKRDLIQAPRLKSEWGTDMPTLYSLAQPVLTPVKEATHEAGT